MVLKGSLQKERSMWMWKSKPCDFIPSQRIRLRSPKKLRKQSLCLTAIAEWPHPFPFRTGRWNALAPMIVGCISGESRSLSGSPFKTLESFLSRVLFYALLKNQEKERRSWRSSFSILVQRKGSIRPPQPRFPTRSSSHRYPQKVTKDPLTGILL